ncbi:MAG: zf-HC2 domain-containing protein [Actinomycetota bacterium]
MTSSPTPSPWPVDQARIDANWRAITIELDAPVPGRMERLLRAVGLPARFTRLVVATPALRRAWYLATGLAILISIGAATGPQPREDLFMLLLVAPLVPVLGVALAYGTEADPAHEMAMATPMRGLRLVLTRAAAVLAFSTFWLLIAAVLAPGRQPMAFAWLLPALGLTSATVALMTVLAPRRAAMVAAGVWVTGVLIVQGAATDPLAAFGPAGQVVMVVVGLVSFGVTVLRRQRFDVLELRA